MDTAILLPAALWVICAAACAWRARVKGYSYAAAFAAAILLSPITVAVILAFLPFKEPTSQATRTSLDARGVDAIAAAYAAKRDREVSAHKG